MPSILLTNHHLKNFSGSELLTLDLAKYFKSKGWNVDVATFDIDDPLNEYFNVENINIINLLKTNKIMKKYDLIWSHHHPMIIEYLRQTEILPSKIVISCLSPFEQLETPSLITNYFNLVLANSKETRDELVKCGVTEEKIFVFPNSVSEEWINFDKKEKSNSSPEKTDKIKIAVISNHPPSELLNIKEYDEDNFLEINYIGQFNEYELVTPKLLNDFDAIITIGRTVQQSISQNIPVYCYDYFGGPGWLNETNYNKAEYYNFSGRCCRRKLASEEIYRDLVDNYDFAKKEIKKLHKLFNNRFILSQNISNVLDFLKKTQNFTIKNFDNKLFYQLSKVNESYIKLLKKNIELEEKINQIERGSENKFLSKESFKNGLIKERIPTSHIINTFNNVKENYFSDLESTIDTCLKVGRKIYIWGTGSAALVTLELLRKDFSGILVYGFIDNNPEKWGRKVNNLTIYSPNILVDMEEENKPFVVIGSSYYGEINKQLFDLNYYYYRDYCLGKFY